MDKKTITLGVRICDPETSEFLDYSEYNIEVESDFNIKADDVDMGKLFSILFDTYPEDFPEEDPGVDATIEEITDGDETVSF